MFFPCSPKKPVPRVTSLIPYNKQPFRPEKTPDKALDKFYETDSVVLRKKVKHVDMSKTLPRSELFKTSESTLNYEPNKEALMQNLGRVLSFDNMSRRRELFIINPTPDPYDINLSATAPCEKSFSMAKKPKMFANDKCPLPSFMQTVHTRLSMGYSSMKSINPSFQSAPVHK